MAKVLWAKCAKIIVVGERSVDRHPGHRGLCEHRGRHSLFHAVQHGMLDVVAELIKEGADVHEEDNIGDTVLYYADEIEDEDKRAAILSLLAEHGLNEEEEEDGEEED